MLLRITLPLVETFEKGLGYRNIRIHNSAIYEFLKGEAAYGYVEKLKLALSSIRNHMFSEFILCDNDKLNEIEENIWISRNIRRAMKEGELFLVYQPIVDIGSQRSLGQKHSAVGCLRNGVIFRH